MTKKHVSNFIVFQQYLKYIITIFRLEIYILTEKRKICLEI